MIVKENDEEKNNTGGNIIFWVIVGITGIIAVMIGQSLGIRSRSILYILVALEAMIYYGMKWLFDNFKK